MKRAAVLPFTALTVVAAVALLAAPAPAQAFDATKPICKLAGLVSTIAGKVCDTARHAGSVLKAGQKLLGGHLGSAVETLAGSGTPARVFTATAAFAAAGAWVVGGARVVLHETASVISTTTRPQLQSTWFSSTYWRMAGISALLTLPFLFAAAVQAILRSDLSLLLRSVLGYLPLGLLAVSIAAPLTQLLLAASDEMSALVSSASGYTAAGFSHVTGLGILSAGVSSFPFFFVGLLAVAATMTLWIELLIRSAAVYVIVLMLPLFFAALVWPARRVWAVRAIEVLVALVLAKFAIVAVLALGGAALGHSNVASVTQMLAGTTLVMLAAFAPWALLRLLPLHELASGVEGLRGGGLRGLGQADAGAAPAHERVAEFVDALAAGRAEQAGTDAARPSAARAAVEGLPVADPRGEDRSGTSSPAAPAGDQGESAQPDSPGAADAHPAPAPGPGPVPDGDLGNAAAADALREVLGDGSARGGQGGKLGAMLGPQWEGGNLNGRILELGPESPLETLPAADPGHDHGRDGHAPPEPFPPLPDRDEGRL